MSTHICVYCVFKMCFWICMYRLKNINALYFMYWVYIKYCLQIHIKREYLFGDWWILYHLICFNSFNGWMQVQILCLCVFKSFLHLQFLRLDEGLCTETLFYWATVTKLQFWKSQFWFHVDLVLPQNYSVFFTFH